MAETMNGPNGPSVALRYGCAVASVVVCLALKGPLDPLIHQWDTPFLLFFAPVMLSAWYGGLGPGLLATGLAAGAIDYYFLPPPGSLKIESLSQGVRLALFVAEASLITYLTQRARRAPERTRASLHRTEIELAQRERAEGRCARPTGRRKRPTGSRTTSWPRSRTSSEPRCPRSSGGRGCCGVRSPIARRLTGASRAGTTSRASRSSCPPTRPARRSTPTARRARGGRWRGSSAARCRRTTSRSRSETSCRRSTSTSTTETFRIGEATVSATYLNHPGMTLGYRIERAGKAVVYATDHEPYRSTLEVGSRRAEAGKQFGRVLDDAFVAFVKGADLYIGEAQYTDDEYPGKIGWGHSSLSATVEVALQGGVKALALFHHDPVHSDDVVMAMELLAKELIVERGASIWCFAAREGQTVEI